jgi:hypothetical protein
MSDEQTRYVNNENNGGYMILVSNGNGYRSDLYELTFPNGEQVLIEYDNNTISLHYTDFDLSQSDVDFIKSEFEKLYGNIELGSGLK